jgi:hypothetical protein
MRGTATMMFGHCRDAGRAHRAPDRVRELQDECGVFTAFIPWTYQPENTPMKPSSAQGNQATSAEYLRMLALSRIYLHNVDHIQSSLRHAGHQDLPDRACRRAQTTSALPCSKRTSCRALPAARQHDEHLGDRTAHQRRRLRRRSRRNMLYQHIDLGENNQLRSTTPRRSHGMSACKSILTNCRRSSPSTTS